MSTAIVQAWFDKKGISNKILEFQESSATVELAAQRLGCEPGMIAKTLALRLKDGGKIVIVVMGTARIDNRKYKDRFGCKAQMMSFDETLEATGHAVGGVCPFALPEDVAIYLDESLKRYATVYPAAGSANSAVAFTPDELTAATGGTWVDVCKEPETAA